MIADITHIIIFAFSMLIIFRHYFHYAAAIDELPTLRFFD
jgi:hypothetical protein